MSEREMVSAERARAVIELHEAAVTGTKDITVAVTTLAATAPDLARTVIALHAIIEGRTTAPTDAELAAHDERGALWMIAHRDGQIVVTAMSWPSSRDWHVAKGATRWWPLESDGRPCAWPVTGVRDGR